MISWVNGTLKGTRIYYNPYLLYEFYCMNIHWHIFFIAGFLANEDMPAVFGSQHDQSQQNQALQIRYNIYQTVNAETEKAS